LRLHMMMVMTPIERIRIPTTIPAMAPREALLAAGGEPRGGLGSGAWPVGVGGSGAGDGSGTG